MADNKMFQEAMQAIEEGQRERAKDLLTRLLKTEQKNVDYWLWLSSVVDTTSEKIFCLESVIKIDPTNQLARRGLILLGTLPPDESTFPVAPVRRKWSLGPAEEEVLPKSRLARLMRKPAMRVATIIVSTLLIAGLVVLGVFLRPYFGNIAFIKVSGTAKALVLPSSTPTLPSPTPRQSPTPPYKGPIPLWMTLKETYTPTPRYINTPHPVQEAYRIAMRRFDQGEYSQMITYLEQAIRESPDSPDLLYYLGEAYRMLGNQEKALEAYLKAIEVNANFAPAYVRRAQIYLATTPNAQVEGDFQKAIELDPVMEEAYLERAAYSFIQGDDESALKDLETAASLNPNDPRVFVLRAQIYLKQGNNEEALKQAQTAYALDLTQLPVYRILAEVYLAKEDYQAALENVETFLRYEQDDPQAWLILGLVTIKSGKKDQAEAALTALNKALELNSKLSQAYRYRGQLYLELGEGQKAVNDLIEAQRFEPNSFEINLDLGRALWIAQRYGDAFDQLRATEGLAEDDQQRAAVYYWRGQVLVAGQNPRAAEQDYRRLLALPEESVPAEWRDFAQQQLLVLNPPTATATATLTRTLTPTVTLTPTRSSTTTLTPSRTLRPTITLTPSRTPTPSLTFTASLTAPITATRIPTRTRTPSRTPTRPARTPTPTP